MKKVILYTTPGCMSCRTLAKSLDKRGIVYDTINLAQNPEMLEQLTELGYREAPIVTTEGFSFSGFRQSKIDELERRVKRENAGRP